MEIQFKNHSVYIRSFDRPCVDHTPNGGYIWKPFHIQIPIKDLSKINKDELDFKVFSSEFVLVGCNWNDIKFDTCADSEYVDASVSFIQMKSFY